MLFLEYLYLFVKIVVQNNREKRYKNSVRISHVLAEIQIECRLNVAELFCLLIKSI
jgi:hypothetical protein